MPSNVAISYIITLVMVGFFLWVIRGIVRGLNRRADDETLRPFEDLSEDSRKIDWPVQVFLKREDDIPLPGRLVRLTDSGAFLRCSAPLEIGQRLSLYIEQPQEYSRVGAEVIWRGEGRRERPMVQVRFDKVVPALLNGAE